jgi:hypothetical protein
MQKPPRINHHPQPATLEVAAPRARRASTFSPTSLGSRTCPGANDDLIRRRASARLDVAPGAAIPAREAYADFCQYARQQRCEPWSETRFGRAFTAEVHRMDGHKVKRRDRTYYVGFAVTGRSGADEVGCKKPAAFCAPSMPANAIALA